MLEFEHLMRRTVQGQATELGWIEDARDDVSASEYLEMVTSKTSWYTTVHPCRVGALLGSGSDASSRPTGPVHGTTRRPLPDLR